MKRIVDGITYNTDTALRLGHSVDEETGPATLFQTKGGAFFLLIDDGPVFRAVGPGQAKDWLNDDRVEIYHNPFITKSKAVEAGGTLAVRVPATLKRAVEQAAKSEGVSGNVWTMRCLERGVRDAELIQILGTVANTFQYLEQNDKRLKRGDRTRIGRTTMIAVEAVWRRRFPTVPIDEMRSHIIDQWDEELESHVTGEPMIG